MNLKWPANKVIHRCGLRFVSDNMGFLSVDIDAIKKRLAEIDPEWIEIITKETLTKEEKSDLLSAFKCYGFDIIIEPKTDKTV